MAQPAKKGNNGCGGICRPFSLMSGYLHLPRPSQDNVMFWYIPMAGAASYTAFSVHIFNPNALASLFPESKRVVANCLLFNAHLGSGLYLFSRRHLAIAPIHYRLMYSVYGTLLFNFGSILLWAVTKVILPDNSLVKGAFAVASSLCMIFVGKEYVDYIDRRVSPIESTNQS